MCNLPILPPEIILKIFALLGHEDRLNAACVCQQWADLAFSATFCRNICIKLRPPYDLAPYEGGFLYQRCRNASLECAELTDSAKCLLDIIRNSFLEHLSVTGNGKAVNHFLKKNLCQMEHLTNLCIKVDASDCAEALKICHPKIVSLQLTAAPGFSGIEIKCPCLVDMKVQALEEKCVEAIVSMSGSLQKLEFSTLLYSAVAVLSKGRFENVKKLLLKSPIHTCHLQQLFEQMPNLEELELRVPAVDTSSRFIGKVNCRLLKNLTRLTLVGTHIDATFIAAVARLKQLEMLRLEQCTVIMEDTGGKPISSTSVTEFFFTSKIDGVLPCFPSLRKLTYLTNQQATIDMFELICQSYPQLETLNYGANPGQLCTFHSGSSLAHLNKLGSLQHFQITRMSLENLDWAICRGHKVQTLKLTGCSINGTRAKQIVESFAELHELFIDHSYLRQPSEVFDIDENCTIGLRRHLPRCRVSYYDCHIEARYGTCGSRRMSSN